MTNRHQTNGGTWRSAQEENRFPVDSKQSPEYSEIPELPALSHVNIVIHCNLGIPYNRPYTYILRKNILWMIERIFHFGMTKERVLVRFVIKSYYQICFYFHIHLYGSFSRPPPHHHSLKWVWTLLSRKFNLHVIMFSLVPSRGEHEDRRRPTQGNVLNFILRHIFPTFRFIIALWILA